MMNQITNRRIRIAAFIALCSGLPVGVMAQDSVSRNANGGNGLPGDALSPWTGSQVRANYIVDLVPLITASGTRFGIAPVVKSGRTNPNTRFTSLNGASSISPTSRPGATYPASTYSLWTAPGGGVHPTDNDAALIQPITPTGSPTVFGIGHMDFDEVLVSATNVFTNQIFGSQVAYDPADPGRLYVTRVSAAVNGAFNMTDRSQFGYGGIDADGNVCFRADGFGATGPTTNVLRGDNYFRVRIGLRNSTQNVIDDTGGAQPAATDWVMQRATVTHNTPSLIPAELAGRPFLIGADFLGNLRSENPANTMVSSAAHRPNTTDHRGGIGVSGRAVFSGSVATGAVLSRHTSGGGKTDAISVFGLDATGAVTAARTLQMPTTLLDACDAFAWPLGGGDFRSYDSQVTFRGGSSPVTTTLDQQGRAIAAAVLYNGSIGIAANPFNAIAAVRFDPSNPNSTPSWTTIGWVNSANGTGKDLTGDYGADGAPGTGDAGEGDGVIDHLDAPIGRLTSLADLGTGQAGPSISSPTFDSAGNAYFIASASLKKRIGPVIQNENKLVLVRAVLNPDTFCYRLDVALESGQVFRGANSGRDYKVTALNLADTDSISSASVWSASAMQHPWNNTANAGLPTDSPIHLGGLVLSARIVYDVDGDGQFRDPTATGGDVNSVDEGYNIVLYIGNTTPPSNCIADYNQDGGVDGGDVEAFFLDWEAGDSAADVNTDGGVDGGDVEFFFLKWEAGEC